MIIQGQGVIVSGDSVETAGQPQGERLPRLEIHKIR